MKRTWWAAVLLVAVAVAVPGAPALAAPAATVPGRYLGWTLALATTGDAEGTVFAGTPVEPQPQAGSGNGLATPARLGSATPGSGLGAQAVGAAPALWIPDTSPTGIYSATLTLTPVSP